MKNFTHTIKSNAQTEIYQQKKFSAKLTADTVAEVKNSHEFQK